jgi:predicted acyltransferase
MGGGAEGPHAWIPSTLTVFLGVLAGRVLLRRPGAAALRPLLRLGAALLAAGAAMAPVLPLNKHLWTPSYVLFTGGIGLLLLTLTHWLVDVRGVVRPVRALETLGRNAIVAFVVSELLFRAVLGRTLQPALVGGLADRLGAAFAAYLYPVFSVVVIWGVTALLRRRGIVVRV